MKIFYRLSPMAVSKAKCLPRELRRALSGCKSCFEKKIDTVQTCLTTRNMTVNSHLMISPMHRKVNDMKVEQRHQLLTSPSGSSPYIDSPEAQSLNHQNMEVIISRDQSIIRLSTHQYEVTSKIQSCVDIYLLGCSYRRSTRQLSVAVSKITNDPAKQHGASVQIWFVALSSTIKRQTIHKRK